MNKSLQKFVFELGQMVIGIAMSAFSVACFALPYDMVVAGVSGIGRLVNHYSGISVSMVALVINVALFVLGYVTLGKKFAGSIILATFAFPFFLEVFQDISALQHLVNDPLLAAICAGVLDGVGIGMVIRIGGSTGGTDIPCVILNRKFGIKIAPVMYGMDVAIFLSQVVMTDTNGIILGILYSLIFSIVMDKILVMSEGGVAMMIFSKGKSKEINEKLLEIGFGSTLMPVRGGYIQDAYDMIYCVVSSRYLNRVKRAALAIDEHAFITISSVNEVNGNGFTKLFKDEDYVFDVAERREGIDLTEQVKSL